MTGGAATAPRSIAGRLWGATVIAAGALVVVGCTTVPGPRADDGGETLSGRLALRVDAQGPEAARSFSAAFDLRGAASAGSLGLSTPLGSMLAQARWSPTDVVLVTPQGTRRFASLDALTRDVLGESVPIEAWFDWLHGRPWPGAPSTPVAASTAPSAPSTPESFMQLGWAVDLSRFVDGAVSATRASPAPTVTVRIRLDRS
ncbi:MAG: lipoprotein insertase outer membrane protein LolB [Caldimonas sp.]